MTRSLSRGMDLEVHDRKRAAAPAAGRSSSRRGRTRRRRRARCRRRAGCGSFGVFDDDVDVAAKALIDPLPGLPEIRRPEGIGQEVIQPVLVDGEISRPGIVPGEAQTDETQAAAGRPLIFAGDVRPGLSAVPRELNVAVVRSHPDGFGVARDSPRWRGSCNRSRPSCCRA